jgi:hypothetical protein
VSGRGRIGRASFGLVAAGAVLLWGAAAAARPTGPRIFCDTYASSPFCQGRLPTCNTCHTSTAPPAWNAFGDQVRANLHGDFDEKLGTALLAIQANDADGDGVDNAQEIAVGTMPGDASDVWLGCGAPTGLSTASVTPGIPGTSASPIEPPIGPGYDEARAFTRVMALYCGRSPNLAERKSFEALAGSRADAYTRIHDTLKACLDTRFWRDEGLPRLADPLVRPVGSPDPDKGGGMLLADFTWDYRLFTYILTGDRDARELLTAKYHVDRADDGTLHKVEGVIADDGLGGGEPLDVDHRAGMITTQWFLVINTMLSDLPRTTAAQAYRAYLGQDIARQEGIWPIPDEPKDYDKRGVTNPDCAQCHATLDPLSYGFAYYEGVSGKFGSFNPDRPKSRIPDWQAGPSYLFGKPVNGVVEWAEAAVQTDFFKRTLGRMFFRHAIGRDPLPAEVDEFEAIWKKLPDDGFSANRLVARIVDSSPFGGT